MYKKQVGNQCRSSLNVKKHVWSTLSPSSYKAPLVLSFRGCQLAFYKWSDTSIQTNKSVKIILMMSTSSDFFNFILSETERQEVSILKHRKAQILMYFQIFLGTVYSHNHFHRCHKTNTILTSITSTTISMTTPTITKSTLPPNPPPQVPIAMNLTPSDLYSFLLFARYIAISINLYAFTLHA